MDQELIGKFIKKIRENNHQTQKEFSETYNVSFQAVSKWENGKNIPDLSILKQICKDNNISIDELLGNNSIKTKKNKVFFLILIIVILILISVIVLNFKDSSFEFKKISTTCETFKITGSVAYNKDKSSIYISNVEFCGKKDNIIYKKIEYNLYERNDNITIKISSGENLSETTLIDYLKNLKINVNDYSQTCKYFSNSNLYIEISATDINNKITTYKIPLLLEDNCE